MWLSRVEQIGLCASCQPQSELEETSGTLHVALSPFISVPMPSGFIELCCFGISIFSGVLD